MKARWPADVVEVSVGLERRWLLADDVDRLDDRPDEVTRLLAPFDLYLQARDRSLLVPDAGHAKDLWRMLGRPGGVLVDGEVVGTWRAKKSGPAVTVSVELWAPVDRGRLADQAERLAAFRGSTLAGVEVSG